MRRTCLVSDPRFRLHDAGDGHPERPERLATLERLFEEPRWKDLPRVPAREASEAELLRVHGADHLRAVAQSASRPRTRFDADTLAGPDSFLAAKLAAGSAIAASDEILAGTAQNGFAALRPPGHHAEHDRAMGFCLINNVAAVAAHLRARGCERVMILDWDVHHGNGTQQIFYDDPSVLYVSLHQYPFYPGTGASREIGRGAGEGSTVNLPLPAGAGPAEYLAAVREVVVPVAERFEPRFVLVSAGFDAHAADPLAQMLLDEESFAVLTDAAVAVADASAGGKLLALLEGGYDLCALQSSVATVLARLAEPREPELGEGELTGWSRDTARALSPYWKISPER